MYTLYKFHFLNGISEINQLFDDILIIWPAPVCDLSLCVIASFYLYSNTHLHVQWEAVKYALLITVQWPQVHH